jgi:hypothetical protein
MSIKYLIENNPTALASAKAGDVEAVLEVLNAPTITRRNSAMIGPAGLAIAFAGSPQIAATACGAFEAAAATNPLLKALYGTFQSAGFDFSHPATRTMIDQIFTGDLTSVGTALKSIGEWQVSPAVDAIGRDATEADVVAATSAIQREALQARLAVVLNERVWPKIASGELATLAEIAAEVAEG